MTRRPVRRSDYVEFGDREIDHWPGVTVEREMSSQHLRVTLTYEGRSRFVIAPGSGSDVRGPLNHVQDLRRVLRQMGAQRSRPPVKASGARAWRRLKIAPPGSIRLPSSEQLRRDPSRDPFAGLARLDLKSSAPPPEVQRPCVSWWRKALHWIIRRRA